MEHLANNIIVIGGHLSNPGFNELTKGIMLEYHFEEHKIVDTNGNELSFGEGYYSGLLIVGKNTYYPTNKKMVIIAGSHGPDTRHIAQAITKREYVKILNEEIRKRQESEVIEFVVKLKRIGETRPEEFIVSCKPCTLKR